MSTFKNAKRCYFCGQHFTGQQKDFEHIIPRWLVKIADLKKRTMPVMINGEIKNIPMKKIGGKACKECNSNYSNLEGKAKSSYDKIANNVIMTHEDIINLLDWFDKIRVGLWLWILQINSESDYPKFHINQRIASKDRILIIKKYSHRKDLKGLAFWGVDDAFIFQPSCFGVLINNIAIINVSSDFFIAKHIKNIIINNLIDEQGDSSFEVSLDTKPSERTTISGSPIIFGQCIMPTKLFKELEIPILQKSKNHGGLSEGKIINLDHSFDQVTNKVYKVPEYSGNVDANIELIKKNTYTINEFLLKTILNAELTDIEDKENLINRIENYRNLQVAQDKLCKIEYKNITGISL